MKNLWKGVKLNLFIIFLSVIQSNNVFASGWIVENGTSRYVKEVLEGETIYAKNEYIDGCYLDLNGYKVNQKTVELLAIKASACIYENKTKEILVPVNTKELITEVYMSLQNTCILTNCNILPTYHNGNYGLYIGDENIERIKEESDIAEDFITQMASTFNNLSSDREKVIAINSWICETFEYDYSFKNYSIYNFIKDKTGTCEAYSNLFKMLCNKVGIECNIIRGTGITNKFQGYHAWNEVILKDEGTFYCDTCWNDGERDIDKYLLLTKEEISKNHIEENSIRFK